MCQILFKDRWDLWVYIHTYIYAYVYVYIYIYIYMYTYTDHMSYQDRTTKYHSSLNHESAALNMYAVH